MKEQVEIERLLRWAYRDELSKRTSSSAEGIWERIAENGMRGGVDRGQSAAQRYPHFGLPHPDAERIEKAVAVVPDLVIDWDAEAEPIMGDLIALADPRSPGARKPRQPVGLPTSQSTRVTTARWRSGRVTAVMDPPRDVILVQALRTAAIVVMHASMGTRPDWREVMPRPEPVPADRGPNVKIVGECRGKWLYTAGSYCPLTWAPSPIAIASARADYLAWWRGLARLALVLRLDDFEPLPPTAPEMPWRDPEAPAPPIHAPLIVPVMRPLPLKPQRKLAGPRKQAPRASEVREVPHENIV